MEKRPTGKQQRDRLELFERGITLLRLMAAAEVSRQDAGRWLGMNYREWHRWLRVFEQAGIRLRRREGRAGRVFYSLSKTDWTALIE